MAKRLDQAYQPGRRAMQKYKLWHTVDCVVGGVYLDPRGKQVQSVLLGLYDKDGKLHCRPQHASRQRPRHHRKADAVHRR